MQLIAISIDDGWIANILYGIEIWNIVLVIHFDYDRDYDYKHRHNHSRRCSCIDIDTTPS